MFTGIIEAVGTVRRLEERGGDIRLHIASGKLDLSDVKLGDSIATNGVCLTAVELPGDGYVADVSKESIRRTALSQLSAGSPVNLEKAMQPTSRFGGHIVSGHVDGVGKIIEIKPSGRSVIYRVEAPAELARYIAEKGSITVDGVSLTINAVEGSIFSLNIVPHTAQETTIANYRTGSRVNLEVDIIARYLERLLSGGDVESAEPVADTKAAEMTESFLAENGFMRRR
ncbi:riboflavin synthase [Sansalvadorimonas sp. 2012CJ34-2]|uniref:Riboflavin synthase n=1 Tax=Parendozoicomonas callyspongiae TaxID=2942213 RepID=A0ABT0PGJ3_9GAMM|nr:riboflavin synthase [Sansalvadorimonas sp. 2012CJ34-2]MCL6270473.1 riboflavin synthase [Sansalvadorimonas sp. 2012CJ34-2]